MCSNQFGVASHHFSTPKKGDRVTIFQRVHGVSRVITHILEFQDNNYTTFAHLFPNNQNAINHFGQWPNCRETKILAVLKPSAFGGVRLRGCADLSSTQSPIGHITLDSVTGSNDTVSNGRIHTSFGGHDIVSAYPTLIQQLKASSAYSCSQNL